MKRLRRWHGWDIVQKKCSKLCFSCTKIGMLLRENLKGNSTYATISTIYTSYFYFIFITIFSFYKITYYNLHLPQSPSTPPIVPRLFPSPSSFSFFSQNHPFRYLLALPHLCGYIIPNIYMYVSLNLWFVVSDLWFVICDLWFVD